MTTAENNATSNTTNLVSPTDNVEFGRNTMCHFLSSFFRSLTRVTDVQQEKFFNSINQIVINTPSVFVTDSDKQHTLDDIRTTNSYLSLLIWTLSSKKFTSIQENTIGVLANLYGELSLRWPALFRIFTNELIDTLNDTIKYDVEFIEEEIHQPKRLYRFIVPEQVSSSFSNNVTIERCIIEFTCSDDISSFQINLISVLKHLASTLSTLLDRQTISNLIGTLCELIRTGDIHVKSATFSFLSTFIQHRSLGLLMNDLTSYVHFSISDILLTIMNFIHTEPKHSIQLEHDFAHFIHTICQNHDEVINFFIEHIGFVIPRLKDLLVHVSIASKADIEFHMNNRSLRLFGEVQTEIYLEQFCIWLTILFECGQRDIGINSLLVIHAYEIVEHLLANLDECLLAKYLNHALGKVIIWLIQEKYRASPQSFRVRRIRLLKTIWQHLKTTLEKSTFNNEEDALQRVFNVYCLITSVSQAYISCQIRQIKLESIEENEFYASWLTIDEINSIYGYLINTLVYLGNSVTVGLFSLAYEYVLATIVATSVYISDQLDNRLREDTLSILCLSWLSSLSDWHDFQPRMDTCKITKQLAQTFQSKFNQNDRLISLKCLSLFNAQFYPKLRLHIFSLCLHDTDINTQLMALKVLPLMQYNLQTTTFLSIFYTKYCSKNIDERLKPIVMDIWRTHRCLFDVDANTIQLKIHDYFDQTIFKSFELICTACLPFNHHLYMRTRSSTISCNSTSFSLSNILPIFHLFNQTSMSCNYLSLIHFFQTFDYHPSFIRPLNDTDENFLQLKSFFNSYLNENNQERLCLLSIMPYLFKTILISNNRQWDNSLNDNLDQFLFDTLTQLNNDAIRQAAEHHDDDYSRLIHLCGLIARRTCNEDIFVFVLFILINGLATSFQHTSQIELMNIAKDEYLQNQNKFQLNKNKNLLTINEKIDLTSIVQQHTDSLYRLISQSLLLNSEQPADICLRHLHLLFSMMQQNGSSFNTYLKRILPDLLPWIVEERSINASRVVQHIRTAVKMSKKKVIFDAFPAIYSHVWRHVRLPNNNNGDYSMNRIYEVNEFIEQEAGADLAAVFRFGGPPIFSKLLLYISTHPEHVMKGLQMAVGILDGISLTADKDYSNVVTKECVYKALQSKLLGILCDFETELLSTSTPLHSKKRVLLSLTEVLKIMQSPQIVATRVKLLRSLRLALQCSPELSLIVFNLWEEFIRHLKTNLDILSSMILQLIASLLPFHEINSEHFQELILLMLSHISSEQIALITDDLLLIPQLNQMEKIKTKLIKCKKQHTELHDNQIKIKNDERSLLENKFQRLITLLNFDMVDIRIHALNSLQILLKTNRPYLLQICLSRDTVPSIITRLILTLLERSNDSNQNIRFIAIDCLGEIGAIDPGRIEFRKLYSQIATSTSLMNRLLSNTNSEINNDDLKRCYFNLYSKEFALELFAELTRAFLAADQVRQQDTISYAIQECLKFYNLNLSDDNEKVKINQELWLKLNQEQQDLFKPLRTSKYVLTDETNLKVNKSQDAILKQLTIKTYEQWLTQYVPYLIQYLPNNNYYHLFHSCLFAVRFNSSIGSFLLPYIILHLIGENLGQDVLDKEIKALIYYTNQYDSNETNPSSDVLHQIAQIIFTLIDFLLLFSSLNTIDPNEQAKQLNQRKRQQQQQQPLNQDPVNIQEGTWNNLGITRIRDYIRLLHTDLSLARIAFKYDHYTRAYRHFEMYSSADQQINVSMYSEFLLKLFHRLNDQDSAYGIIGIRDMTPKQLNNPRTDIYEEILSYELTGQIDEAIVAYEHVLEIHELNQTNIHLYLGYLNNLLTQQQFQHTIDQSTGIIVQYPTWINMLNPLRIEAAWKLSKWNLLEKFCSYQEDNFQTNQNEQNNENSKMNILHDLNVSKQFEEYIGRILCQAKKQNREEFSSEFRLALNSLMGPISAASMEVGSYQRAYDYLARLHLLKDLEYYIFKNIFHDDDSIIMIDNDYIEDIWSQRHALLPPNSKYIEPSLALRRTLLVLDDNNDNKQHALEIGECWLHSARIARAQNNSLAAIGSLMKASQSHPIEVAIERAQWMWNKGEKDRAIMSLKQKKIELLDSRTANEGNQMENRLQVSTDLKAQLWLLLARYSEQNSPHEAVFEMYKQAQEAAPHWEETHFYLAQFYDTLLSSLIESDPTSSNSTATTTTNNFLSSTGLSLENKLRMMEYIRLAVSAYCRSLKYGCEFIYQSLTRLLTMWLDFASDLVPFIKPVQPTTTTSRKQQTAAVATTNLPDVAQIKQHGQAKLGEITREVSSWTTRIPPYLFLAAFPYMVSRICHSEDMTSKALNSIITQVFAAFPQQTLWMMINLYGSSNSMRRDRCIAIWNEASNIESGLRDFVVEATILIKQLDTLCMHAVTYGQNKISLSAQFKSFKRSYANESSCPILIPIQSQMQVCLPPPPVRFSLSTTSAHVQRQQQLQQQAMNVDLPSEATAKLTAMANKQGPLGRPASRKAAQAGSTTTTGTTKVPQKTYYDARHQPFPDAVVTIHNFEDQIEVLSSLQRPKKILIRGSDGQIYPFLCKSQDDLRVDSRCLDFCHLFNKCLKKNSETRRRQLNIRTYAVYPINERCGLIEWLPNLCTFRSLVTKFYRQRSSNFSEVSNREIKVYGNSKDKTKEARYNDFLKLLAFHQPAVFHQYLFAAYPDPNRWYISRMNFVRSTAVMSMIGYIMGLGDRHCENILLDTCTGETVHVDFNCLFNKGLTFEIPEKVPFRLTHNIVDGMGTLGVEGVFRKTCEIILHLIRDERELLVSVLKTFIYDPLVEWKSATREEVANMKKQQIEGGEVVNMKAQTHVRNILERVRGYCTDELTGKRVVLPLSVEGQVDHLIRQATSNELLCQMFIGWAAYL
ncbi:unnamed protein product [Adineta steineri]|uniref:Serine/threonine-protein kinase ATR n=1 Tax=Adineta steineri TaxID=433720 RepID=A0A819C509_9BILA|nr:unnamed protein product [Adineta steineri]